MLANKAALFDRTERLSVADAIRQRRSVGLFQPDRSLPTGTVESLLELTARAPSAYNLQNWKFIAVETPEAKARLREAAYGQAQIGDASVTIIVCGTLEGWNGLAETLAPSVEAGILPEAMAESWVEAVRTTHTDSQQLQRDEAFRSASLAAMTLMLAAEEMGLATGPMSGFDADAVSAGFGLSPTEIPVMLVTLGYAAEGSWPQKPRRPTEDVLVRA